MRTLSIVFDYIITLRNAIIMYTSEQVCTYTDNILFNIVVSGHTYRCIMAV